MSVNWKQTGYGQMPHLLQSIALPKSTRLITQDLYKRGFNAHRAIQVPESSLAADMACSVRTYIRHLNIAEYAGLIRRKRMGEGNVSIIELLLRPASGLMTDLSRGIKDQLPNVHPALFQDRTRTMQWWIKQMVRHEDAMRPIRGMRVEQHEHP